MANVLIVDDDADAADALAEIMRGEGHEVRVGFDGAEGLRLIEERRPDLVLLDVEMPVLDGPGMAYQMFVHNCGMENIPVVLVSGVAELAIVAARVGTPYFLGKPFRYERLLEMVERALRERTPPRAP